MQICYISRKLTEDDGCIWFLETSKVPKIGGLTKLVAVRHSTELKEASQSQPTICLEKILQVNRDDMECYALPLMYLTGAATETTTESFGRFSINCLRRHSYSSAGIPGVSSCGLTGDVVGSARCDA